ncbi:hypothetical protein Nepgr_031837 [Nepenthes gracilis]|uniref:Uncharacterized protein n=1 Tax=Nepenthes gracilis TaxID=150966 RepID=A0AAD3TIV7_NEPGR|nr:hypothetical protein Nepgr_031837 [Nepenthes gracilis]
MGIKKFVLSIIITSILVLLIYYISTKLTKSISDFPKNSNFKFLKSKKYLVTFAYLISATGGDSGKVKRLLRAIYHPGNFYLIHIDYGAPMSEHLEMKKFVSSEGIFQQVGNVWIVGKSNLVTYRGPTMLAVTLHAMSLLLRTCHWDWFINLSASDYPLVTQDATGGDSGKVKRLLRAIYHPGNFYLIHIDYGAPMSEHLEMKKFVSSEGIFQQVGNVWIVGKSNLVTYRGPTMLAVTLHAMSLLLRTCHWDWFINLSASDYPLVTQDDLIHAFSDIPRDVNFIQHTSHLGWKLGKRGKPIIIDPALYSLNKSEIWWVIKQRTLPTAFKLYTGSAWMILSRSFAEYTIVGWDNLPRTLLLYYTNFVSSPEGYFHTLICNSKDYNTTAVNHDLRFITWDSPPKQHPRYLGLKDYPKMVQSGRPFARKFKQNDPILARIDRRLLNRRGSDQYSYEGWCSGDDNLGVDGGGGEKQLVGCSKLHQMHGVLRPGVVSRRLKTLLTKLISTPYSSKHQCK